MNHILENQDWTVKVKELGAELSSVRKQSTGREYIWQADPNVWKGQAPILFPIVGRLNNDEYRVDGKAYQMKQHGFARKSHFSMLEQEKTRLKFGLTADAQSMEAYPYNFVLDITYQLVSNELAVTYLVINKDQQEMPFSIGAHPAFSAPRIVDQQTQEYHLVFDQPESLERMFIEDGLRNGKSKNVLQNEQILALHPKLFEQDAIIFKNYKSECVSLISQNSGQQLVEMEIKGFPYLGIWQKVGADYICIEPWYGIADSQDFTSEIKNKEGILLLSPGEQFECSYRIRFF